jgi:hypothetical protein
MLRVLCASPVDDHGQIVKVIPEVVDVSTASARSAVSATIELSHGDPLGREGRTHVPIEAAVGGKSMNHDQGQAFGALGSIVLHLQLKSRPL